MRKKEWTVFLNSKASLQLLIEADESLDLEEYLFSYSESIGTPLAAFPGFPVRLDNSEWLFPDGILRILPNIKHVSEPGFTQCGILLIEDSLRAKMLTFYDFL